MAPRQKCSEIPDIEIPSSPLSPVFSSDEENANQPEYFLIQNPRREFVTDHIDGLEAKILIICEDVEQEILTYNHIPDDCTIQDLIDGVNIINKNHEHFFKLYSIIQIN